METQDYRREPRWNANLTLIPAVIVIGIGVLFLLGNLGIVIVHDWFDYWPVILIAVGLVKLVDSDFVSGRALGAILMAVGGLFLADNLGYLHARMEDLWPLLLIGAGLLMLANRIWWSDSWFGSGAAASASRAVNLVAIFGGSKRNVVTQDFQGGSIVAMFGGVALDLRKAGMSGEAAVIDIVSIFGGADIKIPEHWSANVQGVGIFGGFGDNTAQPTPAPGVKRLVVRGVALFGGVGVKN